METKQIQDHHIPSIERFTVLIYDKTIKEETVNEARKQLLTKKNRSIENIPPTKAALLQHLKRSAYQAWDNWKVLTWSFFMRVHVD